MENLMKKSKKIRSQKQTKMKQDDLIGVSGGAPEIRICTANKDGIKICTGQSNPRK